MGGGSGCWTLCGRKAGGCLRSHRGAGETLRVLAPHLPEPHPPPQAGTRPAHGPQDPAGGGGLLTRPWISGDLPPLHPKCQSQSAA